MSDNGFAIFPDSPYCHWLLAGDMLTACGVPLRGISPARIEQKCPMDFSLCPRCEAARDLLRDPLPNRRKVKRVGVSITAHWGLAPQCPYEGAVTSLSVKGCFIRTDVVATLSEKIIFLRIRLPDGRTVALQGRVIYYLRRFGFAMEFEGLTGEDQSTLEWLMELHSTEGGRAGRGQ